MDSTNMSPEASIKSQLKGLMGRGNSERVMVRSDPFTMADTVLNFGEMLVYIGHCEGARAAPTARPTAPITLMGNDKAPVRWVSPSGQ